MALGTMSALPKETGPLITRIFTKGIVRGFPRKGAKKVRELRTFGTTRINADSAFRARHSRLQFAPGAGDIGTDISPCAFGVGFVYFIKTVISAFRGENPIA